MVMTSRRRLSSSDLLSIGEVAARSGLAPSALRFYESRGLIRSERNAGGQRRYRRHVMRRVALIRIAQRMGLSLGEVSRALARLPQDRAPTKREWEALSRSWKSQLQERMATLGRLRDELNGCIGCGCLSLRRCRLYNPGDAAARLGTGPRFLLDDDPGDVGTTTDVEGAPI